MKLINLLLPILMLTGVSNAASVWQSPSLAEAFLNCFVGSLSNFGVFNSDEIVDFQNMENVFLSRINSGKWSTQKEKALNAAFASNIAELIASDKEHIQLKTSVVEISMEDCLVQTTGNSDKKFVDEILSMVKMITKES